MTFGIFVSYDSYFKPVADITMPVLARYCDRHGYSLQIQQNPPVVRTLVWDRALTMIHNSEQYPGWTVHWDADILVTNHSIELEDIVSQFPSRPAMIMARDHTGLNDGIVFTRNSTPSGRDIWERLWSMDNEVSSLAATWRYIAENPEQTLIGEVPQKLLHCYPYADYGIDYPEGTWEPGDFSYHLPGKSTSDRVRLLIPMMDKIVL